MLNEDSSVQGHNSFEEIFIEIPFQATIPLFYLLEEESESILSTRRLLEP